MRASRLGALAGQQTSQALALDAQDEHPLAIDVNASGGCALLFAHEASLGVRDLDRGLAALFAEVRGEVCGVQQ